jgi:hypothetical protein
VSTGVLVDVLVDVPDGTVVVEPDGIVGTTTPSVWAKAAELPINKDKLRLLSNKYLSGWDDIVLPLTNTVTSVDGKFYF